MRQVVGALWDEEARIVQRLIESLVDWLVHALVQLWFIHCLVALAYLLLKWHLVVVQRVFGHVDLILYCFELVGLSHGLLLIGSSSGHVIALLISFQNCLQIALKSSWNYLIIIIYALIQVFWVLWIIRALFVDIQVWHVLVWVTILRILLW